MPFLLPPFRHAGRRLAPLVVAYVNEPAPVLGQHGLRVQIRAVGRRAGRDGIDIDLLVIESGGRPTEAGRGMRLDDVLEAARSDPARRVLYVADPRRLAGGPAAVLRALHDAFATGFEVRAPWGRVSPTGRTVAALRAAAAPLERARRRTHSVGRTARRPGCADRGTGGGPRTAFGAPL